ncbi:MAG: hypothetical protein K1000chlam3_01560 [Chlamydiae bacterium]|nr:hypothetical protein [Chlamydiota bacterium]
MVISNINKNFERIKDEITLQDGALAQDDKGFGLGGPIRDGFFMPLYDDPRPKELQHEQDVATTWAKNWKHASLFNTYNVKVKIPSPKEEQKITEIFTLRVYDSKASINGKNLRFIQFCFDGNEQEESGETKRWSPPTLRSLASAPLNVLEALKKNDILINSMLLTSLGNVIFSEPDQINEKYIPDDIIINRGFTSLDKVYTFRFKNWFLTASAISSNFPSASRSVSMNTEARRRWEI